MKNGRRRAEIIEKEQIYIATQWEYIERIYRAIGDKGEGRDLLVQMRGGFSTYVARFSDKEHWMGRMHEHILVICMSGLEIRTRSPLILIRMGYIELITIVGTYK